MTLKNNFKDECVQYGTKAGNKNEFIHEIVKTALKSEVLSTTDEQELYQAFMEREKIGSTGFGNHIAIPHCRLKNIDDFIIGISLVPEGIDFNSSDGKKVKIAVFLIGPEKERSRHIQALASISKVLKASSNLEALLNSKDKKELIEKFRYMIDDKHDDSKKYEKVLFHIFLQNEDYFSELLELLSALVQGSISVIETNNAGDYLHTAPLYSALWSDDYKLFSRIIVAVIDKDYANELIRKVHEIVPDIEKKPGVMIVAQNVFYSAGAIDF
ncbi:MAG: PTS sugar transporter subunit IIA [Candidatus Muiribacteriota bacterium]